MSEAGISKDSIYDYSTFDPLGDYFEDAIDARDEFYLSAIEGSNITLSDTNKVIDEGIIKVIFSNVNPSRRDEVMRNAKVLFSRYKPSELEAFSGLSDIVYGTESSSPVNVQPSITAEKLLETSARIQFWLFAIGEQDRYTDLEITGLAAAHLFHQEAKLDRETEQLNQLCDASTWGGSRRGNSARITQIEYSGQNLDYSQLN